jgi:nicotinamidase-related amidase
VNSGPLLVVVDLQVVFADPASPWCAPGFAAALPAAQALLAGFGERAVLTRFVAPEQPTGAWAAYYRQWPFALRPPDAPLWDLVPDLDVGSRTVLDLPTFGKWGDRLAAELGDGGELVLAGVSTDCCVLSTALAAADAGVAVRVAADACAGASAVDHRRALDAMALYAPLITVTTVAELLAARTAERTAAPTAPSRAPVLPPT